MKRAILSAVLIAAGALGGWASGFHTSGDKLLDANGNEFIMRGCNYSFAWQRGHEESVIPAAKRIGCNTIRIQLTTGRRWQKCIWQDIEKLIDLCERNKLVAVFNTHDETGSDRIADLMSAVDYWIEMKDLLNAHKGTVIVNISNEWCGTWNSSTWADGYRQAVKRLRDAGIENTLMIDAAGWGQYPKSIGDYGKEIVALDPDRNLMFSVHVYQDAGPNEARTKLSIDYAASAGVPAVVGEFAYEHQGHSVAYQTVLDYCTEKGLGYLAWSWTGNGPGAQACDMFAGYDESQWKPNGEKTVKGPNGIQATSRECSVFGAETATSGSDTN